MRQCVPLRACWGLPHLVQTPQAHYLTSPTEPVSSSVKLGTVIFTLWHSGSISLHPPFAALEWVCVGGRRRAEHP